jgi:hypothetical protein
MWATYRRALQILWRSVRHDEAVFTVQERERVRAHVLELARSDSRVVAGAEVGSLALGGGDRWSDLDLTFGVTEGVAITQVLDEWTRDLSAQFDAVHLFDLVAGSATYRVFLLPDYLQLDVSLAPASQFHPTSPRFKLLFGEAGEPVSIAPTPRGETLGWAVLWARHARICIERHHLWQAEYAITNLRHHVMTLACLRLDLPAWYGKGFDRLPAGVRDAFDAALVRSLERDELIRAMKAALVALVKECEAAHDDEHVVERVREMTNHRV